MVESILARDWLSWRGSRWPHLLVVAMVLGLLGVAPPAMAADGAIQGTITDSAGAPLEGVEIEIYRYEERWDYWDYAANASSDESGAFSISVPAGDYRACFYSDQRPIQCHESAGSVETANDIVVPADDSVTIDVELADFSYLQGRLTDPNGDPAIGVRVDAYTYDRQEDEWFVRRRAITDEDGNYSIEVGAGTFRLGFAPRNREFVREYLSDVESVWEATDVELEAEETVSNLDATLGFNSGISGSVTRPGGWGDSDTDDNRVQVIDAETGAVMARTRVALDGTYGVWGLEAGSYRVAFNRLSGPAFAAAQFYDGVAEQTGLAAADTITISEGERRLGIDANLQRGGEIVGRLVDRDGVAMDGCLIQAYTPDNSLVTRSAVTNEDGRFTIGGLSTGDYQVRTGSYWRSDCDGGTQYFTGNQQLSLDPAAVEHVAITRGDRENVGQLRYTRGGRITGQLNLPAGADDDRRVIVRDLETNEVVGADRAEEDGHYEVAGLMGGSYRVTFNRLSGPAFAAAQFFNSRNEHAGPSAAAVVNVDIGEVRSGINATLRRGGSITGLLVNAQDEPLANCEVQAYSATGELVTRSTRSEEDGSFVIGGLATGNYLVRAGTGWRRSVCNSGLQYVVNAGGPLSESADEANPVSITQGAAKAVGVLTYRAKASVSGHVALPEGATYLDRAVVVRDAATGDVAGATRIRRDGSYRVGGLQGGSYRVTFNRLSGSALAAPEFYNDRPEGDGPQSANLITLEAGELRSDVDAELVEGGQITGVVVDDLGEGLGGCLIQAYTEDGTLVTRSDNSSPSGRFRVGGLSTGSYVLRALRDYGGGCRGGTQYFSGGGQLTTSAEDAEPIQVEVGQETSLVDSLTYRMGATIRGKLKAPAGASYNDRQVQVVNIDSGEITSAGYISASEPTYSVRGLVPGSYRVEFARSSGTAIAAAEFYDDVLEGEGTTQAQLIDVDWGDVVTGINATLVKGGTISGTLTNADGEPLQCLVEALTEDDSLVRREDFANRDGSFQIGGLSSGAYVLRVRENRYSGCDEGDRFYGNESGILVPDIDDALAVSTEVGNGLSLPHSLIYGSPEAENLSLPTISGTARVGQSLTANPGTWEPADASFTYQWFAGGTPIDGAIGLTYLATAADAGKGLSVRVTASAEGYGSASVTSAETGPVVAADIVNTVRPTVTGTARVGQRLSSTTGTWTPAGATFTYRWLANSRPITGASASSFTIPASLLGQRISVQVTARVAGLASASVRSTPMLVAPGVIVLSAEPSILGQAKVGKKLSIDPASTLPVSVKESYQWLRNGNRIKGATTATYWLKRADRGERISVRIRYAKTGYSSTTVTIRLSGQVR